MIESILTLLGPLLRILEFWLKRAEARQEKKDVEDFGSALVADDESTVNRLLAELHQTTASPASISTEGD